jgi:predicted enzyme related to lactoylglutathione lyase
MSTIQPIISTSDLDRLRDFYARVFGATEVFRMPEEGEIFYLGLRIGDSDLGLVAEKAGDPSPRYALSIEVESVDELLPLVEQYGGKVRPPNDMPWGQRVAHGEDPDGNLINLTQPVSNPAIGQ